jgi:hypothetical protein
VADLLQRANRESGTAYTVADVALVDKSDGPPTVTALIEYCPAEPTCHGQTEIVRRTDTGAVIATCLECGSNAEPYLDDDEIDAALDARKAPQLHRTAAQKAAGFGVMRCLNCGKRNPTTTDRGFTTCCSAVAAPLLSW